ncbi:hypothetical protein [Intestinibacillus sp. Marseille-P6563]|uniref:hypothetical protein n=1 Tax=Intestinibacillus sp. Marseille-P6563 TaxID=2364792 RepID=UPI000F068491|nr:hypothetical protein [Intestinibacillus sp. Marseille-P6563]
MNKERRSTLRKLAEEIDSIYSSICIIRRKEEMTLDNVPENLQNSDRCQNLEENVDDLNTACETLQDVSELLQSVIDRR